MRKEPREEFRFRNLLVAVGLAVLAAVLIGVYVVSYRDSVNERRRLVKVCRREGYPRGHRRLGLAGGDYLKTADGAAARCRSGLGRERSVADLAVVTDPIYEGEQITLRQFAPATQGGIFAKFSGHERAIAVLGESQQLLAGTLTDGDHVDVVATARYHVGPSRATTKVVLRDLLVLEAPDADDGRPPRAATSKSPRRSS